jgi:ubiquinol-cytochrome c reductase cytochrome c subunit
MRAPGRTSTLRFAALAALLAAALAVGSSRPPLASPPRQDAAEDDERRLDLARSRRLFEDNCLMCHSEELTTYQRLTPKQWTAEVEKMIGWGAPVPPEEKSRLIEYLSTQYPPTTPPAAPARLDAESARGLARPVPVATGPGDPARGGPLYATHCASCHGRDAAGGDPGTSLVEKPVLLDLADYTAAVREGRRRMPSFRAVLTPSQESDILAWLGQRRPAEPDR